MCNRAQVMIRKLNQKRISPFFPPELYYISVVLLPGEEINCNDYFWCPSQLQLSMEVEVVFSRGTLTPEQQKKVPLSQIREEQHQVNGESRRCGKMTLLVGEGH